MTQLKQTIERLYPDAIIKGNKPNVILQNNGSGAYIREWDTGLLGPMPDITTPEWNAEEIITRDANRKNQLIGISHHEYLTRVTDRLIHSLVERLRLLEGRYAQSG